MHKFAGGREHNKESTYRKGGKSLSRRAIADITDEQQANQLEGADKGRRRDKHDEKKRIMKQILAEQV